jgi:hypothetical protein
MDWAKNDPTGLLKAKKFSRSFQQAVDNSPKGNAQHWVRIINPGHGWGVPELFHFSTGPTTTAININ